MTTLHEPLTLRQREILGEVLRPYIARVRRAALFGSRAMGTARPASDIDLALWGDLTAKDVRQISSDFDESYLDVWVDVIAYPLVSEEGLRRHIDLVALDLRLS